MPQITAIAPHPRRVGRYRLDVDQKKVATIDAELVLEAKLRIGSEYDTDLAVRVALGAARLLAFDEGLATLARRGRSVRELERWLRQRQHAAEHVSTAVERLRALGFLDDADFARSFVRSRAIGRGMSRRRIQAELGRRGVSRDLVDAAISEVMVAEQMDEPALVRIVADKKMRSLVKMEPEAQRRRLYGYLARRGFAPELVLQTVSKLTTGPDLACEPLSDR